MLIRDDWFSRGGDALPARILLAGRFARPGCLDRDLIEALIGDEHDILPEPAGMPKPAGRSVLAARDGADLVVVDLSGSVAAVLELVARLRLASDGAQVPLLGVMPSGIDARSEIYLAAVVDETVSHAQMAERLPSAVRRATRDGAWAADDEGLHPWQGKVATATRH